MISHVLLPKYQYQDITHLNINQDDIFGDFDINYLIWFYIAFSTNGTIYKLQIFNFSKV